MGLRLSMATLCLVLVGCASASAQMSNRVLVPVASVRHAEGGSVGQALAALVLAPGDVRQAASIAAYQDLTLTGVVDDSALLSSCSSPATARARLAGLGPRGLFRAVLRGDAPTGVSRVSHVVSGYATAGGAHIALTEAAGCVGASWFPIGIETVGDESRAWRSTSPTGGSTAYLLLFRTRDVLHRLEVTASGGDGLDATGRLAQSAFVRAIPATPTPLATGTPTATPTVTSTPTATGTATATATSSPTPTPTPPAGVEVAGGRVVDASDSSSAHPPGDAVDLLPGGPNGQNSGTYWSAAGSATSATQRSWWVNLGSSTTVSGIQVRLALAGPGNLTFQARLVDASFATVATVLVYSGAASDGQAIDTTFATPVAGARQVVLTFSESPPGVAPGLRTVGVYTP